MATLAPPSSPSTSPAFHRRRKSWARRVERCCCSTLSYFPLVFVYGLTTWAVIVEVKVSFFSASRLKACLEAAVGLVLYGLANSSYTIAVFTSPGSPLNLRLDLSASPSDDGKSRRGGGYDVLPTYEPTHENDDAPHTNSQDLNTVTAKSTGKQRYCKKCNTIKPDRTHHCSTCRRCVLKMDHHCPWLATCVGLRNYKPFLLFLIYTSLFCLFCFSVTASWVWAAITDQDRMGEGLLIVNTILLAVLSGIIGLVLSGFTAWHGYLVMNGQTTIESLEKTRYLSPLRRSMERTRADPAQPDQGLLEQLKETHANALPGVLRPEEGEEERSPAATPDPSNSSPAKDSLQRTFASLEAQREHDRYAAYLDEQDSEKLPNAFDLGWRRNLLHVFGDKPLLWFLPVCNTSGDGWVWEVSPKWQEARTALSKEREARAREDAALREMDGQSLASFRPRNDLRWTPGQGFVNQDPYHQRGDSQGARGGSSTMQMQPLDRRKASPDGEGGSEVVNYDTSSDEDGQDPRSKSVRVNGGTANWNDVPDDLLTPRVNGSASEQRSWSRGRPKGD